LLTPVDHISRRPTDTYYVNKDYCLRAHTSAHQHHLIKQGVDSFLVIGDVYRRDEINRTHYPSFHQIEGVQLYTPRQLFDHRPDDEVEKEASWLLDYSTKALNVSRDA
uniref:Phenylalanyl-tRNA synthetase domain-containing protein n=1 Tax=Parascaris equorum TaxID=6256 RepID=A0A914RG33_PAREQ